MEAILKLCHTDNLLLRGYCSAVMKQFAATPVLREKLVTRGGVRAVPNTTCKRSTRTKGEREQNEERLLCFAVIESLRG